VQDLPALPEGWAVTDVSDRGSDVMEYMAYQIAAGREFIVRSQHNRRCVDEEGAQLQKLHDHLRSLAPAGTYTLEVQAEKGGTRTASMTVSFEKLQLVPPRQPRGDHGSDPLPVWGVIVRELPRPPESKETGPLLEWILLTNRAVTGVEAARGVAADYACRWIIEDYHKAQKTGCGIEELQFTAVERLQPAIALLSAVALTLLDLRDASRREDAQTRPAATVVNHDYVAVLSIWRFGEVRPKISVHDFYYALARLGGHQNRTHDKRPGWLVLWRGWLKLQSMLDGYLAAQRKRCG